MCNLCSYDERERNQARLALMSQASLMEECAVELRALARGKTTAHGVRSQNLRRMMHRLIREIVPEWI